MKGLLLTGGDGPPISVLAPLIKGADLVVAADSGLELSLRAGVEPDLVVGDMDSLKEPGLLDRLPPERVARYPQDKDDTDTEIGLRALREAGCEEITVAGGGGGRLAHTLGLLALFRRKDPPDLWLTATETVRRLTGSAEIRGCRGRTVSFFPLGPVSVIRSRGLKWPLTGLSWDEGDVGISNVGTEDIIQVELQSGALLMILEREVMG
jgi:thiamine pyrophosphokinase